MKEINAAASRARASARKRPLLVCFSHLRWDFVYQRPQHLMSRASRTFEVVYVEEPIVMQTSAPRMRLDKVGTHLTVAVPLLPEGLSASERIAAQRRLLDDLLLTLDTQPRVCWYYTPMALEFSRHVEAPATVYDNMDELSAFRYAAPELLDLERELLRRCDLVFCGGQRLYEAKRDRHEHAHAFPSSIDRRHFERARRRVADPAEQAALPHPRLGFFGVIDERMDLGLLDTLATRRPDWQWVMVGPVAKIDPESLPRRDNVHWLGARTYSALPAYLAHWDVGVMPFALNESTKFISPTKTPEFLAAGVPVVSSAIRDVIRPYGELGLVEIATGIDDWIERAELLLERPRSQWLAQVDRLLSTMSWETTWQAMLRLVSEATRRRGPRRTGPRASTPALAAPMPAPAASVAQGAQATKKGTSAGIAAAKEAGHV